MIEAGAKELNEVVQKAPAATPAEKHRSRALYQSIVFTGFDWQRSGLVEQLARQEDEEVRQRTDVGLPQLPLKEIDKIIDNLKKEIAAVAAREEYERAAQLRDRIKELKQYRNKS